MHLQLTRARVKERGCVLCGDTSTDVFVVDCVFCQFVAAPETERFDDDSVLRNHTTTAPAVLTFAGGLTMAGLPYMHVGMTLDAIVCLIDMCVYGTTEFGLLSLV